MAFKLQLTDEMISFFRSSAVEDADAGRLIRLLIDVADELPLPEIVPQPLTYTLPIFIGQIETFRRNYNQKSKANAERQARFREKQDVPPDMSRVTGVTERYEALQSVTQRYGALRNVTGVTECYEALPSVTECDNARNALIIPNHTTPSQTTLSGGGADGTSQTPPPQIKTKGEAWSRQSYKAVAQDKGWPLLEVEKFCDLNESGRLHPQIAMSTWERNRTPTEAAGGAKAISVAHATSSSARAKLAATVARFSALYAGTEDKDAFIKQNVPAWLEDCPGVPASMQAEFRKQVNDIINKSTQE